jgi:hypothetical protein
MVTPINFSVAAAQRSGSFKSTQTTYPGGYSNLTFSLTGLGSGPGSDYENTANGASMTFWIKPPGQGSFSPSYAFTWPGGPQTGIDGTVDPTPSLFTGLANLPANSEFYVEVILTGTFTVGITGTLS